MSSTGVMMAKLCSEYYRPTAPATQSWYIERSPLLEEAEHNTGIYRNCTMQ